MTTDDATAADLGSGSESDPDSDSSDHSPEPEPELEPESESDSESESDFALERTAIVVCLGVTIVGSTLPWVSVSDVTVYGFETYGRATIAIATVTGVIVYTLDWSKWAMIATFVAGVLVASIALMYVPLGGIGAFVTLLSGAVLAFVGLIGYDKRT